MQNLEQTPLILPKVGTCELEDVLDVNTYIVSSNERLYLVYLADAGTDFVDDTFIELWVYARLRKADEKSYMSGAFDLNDMVDKSSFIVLCYVNELGEFSTERTHATNLKTMWLPVKDGSVPLKPSDF